MEKFCSRVRQGNDDEIPDDDNDEPKASASSSSSLSSLSDYQKLRGIALVRRGFAIPIEPAENGWLVSKIRTELVYERPENRFGNKFAQPKKIPPVRLYIEHNGHLLIPRAHGMRLFRNRKVPLINAATDGQPMADNVKARDDRPLKEEKRRPQQSAHAFVVNHLQKTGGCVLQMPVGTGKTNVGLAVAATIGQKTLWLAHRKNLLFQAARRAREFLLNVRIGYMYAQVCDVDDKDIVFGTVESLGMKVYDQRFIEQFGLVVLDEAHHAAADTFIRGLWEVAAPRMLALTANPSRKDGLESILYEFFSDNKFVVEPSLPEGICLHVRSYTIKRRSLALDEEMCDSLFKRKLKNKLKKLMELEQCDEFTAKQRLDEIQKKKPDDVSEFGYSALASALDRIASRNALIVALVKQALVTPDAALVHEVTLEDLQDTKFEQLTDRERSNVLVSHVDRKTGERKTATIDTLDEDTVRESMLQVERQVLLMVIRKQHVDVLARRLERAGVPSHMIGTYYGDADEEQQNDALHKRVVLCTYALAEEGLDVPTANTLIFGNVRGDSAEQTIGRGLRDKMTDQVMPLIFDITDAWCGMAYGMFGQRRKQFERYKDALRMRSFYLDADDPRLDEPGPPPLPSSSSSTDKKKKKKNAVSSEPKKRPRQTAEKIEQKEAKRAANEKKKREHWKIAPPSSSSSSSVPLPPHNNQNQEKAEEEESTSDTNTKTT